MDDYKYIKDNLDKVLDKKIKSIKHADGYSGFFYDKSTKIEKSFGDSNGFSDKHIIIANTYLWLDSHGDVHSKDVFKESIANVDSVPHLHDHEFKVLAQIGDVTRVYEQDIPWSHFGVDKEGSTRSLLIQSEVKESYNKDFYSLYRDRKIKQHSVGMRYVKLEMAVDPEYDKWKEPNKLWDNVIDSIGNKEEAKKAGYFFYISQAELIEVSAVLVGSNRLTPVYISDFNEVNVDDNDIDDKLKTLEKLIKDNINYI